MRKGRQSVMCAGAIVVSQSAGEEVSRMVDVQALVMPPLTVGHYVLWMLPLTVLLAWLTGRLLGVRRRSWVMAFVAGCANDSSGWVAPSRSPTWLSTTALAPTWGWAGAASRTGRRVPLSGASGW